MQAAPLFCRVHPRIRCSGLPEGVFMRRRASCGRMRACRNAERVRRPERALLLFLNFR